MKQSESHSVRLVKQSDGHKRLSHMGQSFKTLKPQKSDRTWSQSGDKTMLHIIQSDGKAVSQAYVKQREHIFLHWATELHNNARLAIYKHQEGSVSPEIANIETQTKSSVTNCPTYQYRTTPRCSNHFQVCSVRVVDSETMSHRGQSATYISQSVCSHGQWVSPAFS